jgi:hypothetical protein
MFINTDDTITASLLRVFNTRWTTLGQSQRVASTKTHVRNAILGVILKTKRFAHSNPTLVAVQLSTTAYSHP